MVFPPFRSNRRKRRARPSRWAGLLFLALLFVVQIGCAIFFVGDIVLSVFGLRLNPMSWQAREIQEIGAAVGLILGLSLGAIALGRALRRTLVAEQKLRQASGLFMDHPALVGKQGAGVCGALDLITFLQLDHALVSRGGAARGAIAGRPLAT